MEGCDYCILCGSVGSVGKLVWVKARREKCCDVTPEQFFKTLHHHREYKVITDNPALLEKTGNGKSADKKVLFYTPIKTQFYNEKSSKLPFMAGCYEWFLKALPVCECKSEDPNAKHRGPSSTKGGKKDTADSGKTGIKHAGKKEATKVFNDPIHGHIALHPLLVKIIDTPQFQRLRNIKQLGGVYFVYPGASHNRFEHSLGVAHLAGELAKSLRTKQLDELEVLKDLEKNLKKKHLTPLAAPSDDSMEQEQPELLKVKCKLTKLKESLISDRDILCVQIAGLCHDLGHGPFSHLFDGMFIPEVSKKGKEYKKKTHEEASIEMFHHLLKKNDLIPVMKEYGLKVEDKDENDLKFIEELINGPQKNDAAQDDVLHQEASKESLNHLLKKVMKEHGLKIKGKDENCLKLLKEFINGLQKNDAAQDEQEEASIEMFHDLLNKGMKEHGLKIEGKDENGQMFIEEFINGPQVDEDEWPYKGRKREKSFLYEIVSNKRNGIDVDKFDYFARDCHHLGIRNNFDHQRFIIFARVCNVNGWKHICSRDKEVANLYDLFHTRHSLHRRACQHKIKMAVEIMIKDALLKADQHIWFQSSKGQMIPISRAIDDMEAYTKLTDQVIETILNFPTPSPSLEEARKILQRVMTRDLYQCVGQTTFKKKGEIKISEEMKKSLENKLLEDIPGSSKDNFEIAVITFDYGMKDKDPISKAFFYRKNNPQKGIPISKSKVSKILPEQFSEEILRLYWKNSKYADKAKKCFKTWCNKNGFEVEEEDSDAAY